MMMTGNGGRRRLVGAPLMPPSGGGVVPALSTTTDRGGAGTSVWVSTVLTDSVQEDIDDAVERRLLGNVGAPELAADDRRKEDAQKTARHELWVAVHRARSHLRRTIVCQVADELGRAPKLRSVVRAGRILGERHAHHRSLGDHAVDDVARQPAQVRGIIGARE